MNTTEMYTDKVYAGLMGKSMGVRLGGPVETLSWTYDRIRNVYGEINGYLKDSSRFAADDDINGPVFFIRALLDDAVNREMTPDDVGKAWMNYTRENMGMFWWGGEGISTEHTAYANLKRGLKAPESGAISRNGSILAEQIGGQIFIDTWGLIFPGNSKKAADYAEMAASVSHDGEGLVGARFMASCIAAAFETTTVLEIIEKGLSVISEESTYAQVVKAVTQFYLESPEDFRQCRDYLEAEWGYDKYPGACHIIPNAGVCILAMLYGNGDLAKTIEIATMCGWDTDCNAGNAGTIVGVLNGSQGLQNIYRKDINDTVVASSAFGYLNILDIPTLAKEVAYLGLKINESMELDPIVPGEIFFDFPFSGTTHGFRTSNEFKTRLKYDGNKGFRKPGSLEILFDNIDYSDSIKIFWKPFYRRADFYDERYEPVFSPKVYSGQQVSYQLFLQKWEGKNIYIFPYVRDTYSQEVIQGEKIVLSEAGWSKLEWKVPDLEGSFADEIGIILETDSEFVDGNGALGRIYLDEFHIKGSMDYHIDFSKQAVEFNSVTPFAHHQGNHSLEGNAVYTASEKTSVSYTGNYYMADANIHVNLQPLKGEQHALLFRGKGVERYYKVGFDGKGQVSLIKHDFADEILISVPYEWELNQTYKFDLHLEGETVALWINSKKVLSYENLAFQHGAYGYSNADNSEMKLSHFYCKGSI